MDWDIVIGIETHVQLKTKTKQFSGASTSFGNEPNSQGCLVSLAYPGVLPVLNQEAVNCAIKFGLSIGATINRKSIFARKNYFYPDLPKGYQISQFELPIVGEGKLSIMIDNHTKDVRILRAHLEEDAGKSSHGLSHGKSGIDLNRAGTPLLEIVTEPDMSSAEEAVAYAKKLHDLVQWIGICDGNMQEGNFRCDVNVSVKKKVRYQNAPKSILLNKSVQKIPKNKVIKFEGFRSICPVTSQPDWANIYFYSTSNAIEPKPLLKLLKSYRTRGDFHEACIESIFFSMIDGLDLEDLTVYGRFLRRGGIDINPIRSMSRKIAFQNFRDSIQ